MRIAHDTFMDKPRTEQCPWCGMFKDVAAVVYFDVNYGAHGDWRIMSSQASLTAYKEASDDPYFHQLHTVPWPPQGNRQQTSQAPPSDQAGQPPDQAGQGGPPPDQAGQPPDDSGQPPDQAGQPSDPANQPANGPDSSSQQDPASQPDSAGQPDPASQPDSAGQPDPASQPDSAGQPDPASQPDQTDQAQRDRAKQSKRADRGGKGAPPKAQKQAKSR
jgi:hypothetical protein